MKVFWLRLLGTDFVADGDEFVSGVIDVYENSIFRNLSVTRSRYGTNLLGDNIWTGLDANQAGDESETGKIVDGDRWLDTSGRIDIINFRASNVPDATHLTLYHSDLEDDSAFRDEWASFDPIQTHEPFNAIDLERNVKFVISDIDSLDDDAEFLIRVEIGKPTMAPFYRMSKEVLNRYPEWMEMRELHNEPDGAIATPDSLGGQFVNAIAGEWLDDIRSQMKQAEYQLFIDTVDLDQTAWVYETEVDADNDPLWAITGDGVELARASDWAEFLESPEDADVCFLDYEQGAIFSRQKYDDFQLNESTVPQSSYHVWNFVDELGALVDLERLHLETNEIYRWRILDVYRNRGGGGRENFLNAVRRELNLWKSEGISPDPEDGYPDEENDEKVAVPELLDMQDIENDRNPDLDAGPDDASYYFTADGIPTRRFRQLANRLSWQYPATWGRFRWDRAIWDPVGREGFSGFSTTPHIYDRSHPDDIQYGIGGLDDLNLVPPAQYIGAREFSAQIEAHGFKKVPVADKYMPVRVEFEVFKAGEKEQFDNPQKTVWFTIEIEASGNTYYYSFQMSAKSDADSLTPTATSGSYDSFDPFDEIALTTRHDLGFRDKTTDDLHDGTGIISIIEFDTITLVQGQWDVSSGSYVQQEDSDDFNAWFLSDDSEILTYDSGSIDADITGDIAPLVFFESTVTNSLGVQEWTGDHAQAEILINNASSNSIQSSTSYQVPELVEPSDLSNATLNIQITSTRLADPQDSNSETLYGGFYRESDGTRSFLDAPNIDVNSSTDWSDGLLTLSDATTETLTFSTNDTADYPTTVHEWRSAKWTSNTTYDGTIDRVGPWLNGEPQEAVGAHSRWIVLDQLTRGDFGVDTDGDALSHDADHVVTRLKAEVTDQSVGQGISVWLDSNIVESDADFRDIDTYPENAIREVENDGSYSFQPFVVHARLVQVPNKDWNPYMRSGFFFDGQQEYYVFADRQEETFNSQPLQLSDLAHQGAPVIVQATSGSFTKDDGFLREVAFSDDNFDLTLRNEEIVDGTGHEFLFMAYDDVYDIIVEDVDTDTQLSTEYTNTSDHIVEMSSATDVDKDYRIKYNVRGSYIVDRFYFDESSGEYTTRIEVDSQEAANIDEYTVHYEGAAANPYTDADIALKPTRTIRQEGYIFIGRHEYDLDTLNVSVSPSKILADGEDYLLLAIECLDTNDNPKPDQELELSTTFGTFDASTVSADQDGFILVKMTAEEGTDTLEGTVTVTASGITEEVDFMIEPDLSLVPRLFAVPSSYEVEADGNNKIRIHGRVMHAEDNPVGAGVTVEWRRARHIRVIWQDNAEQGSVITESDGTFEIEFTVNSSDDPGYWFIATEATVDDQRVGDVVFWLERPQLTFAVENLTGVPKLAAAFAEPPGSFNAYSQEFMHPYGYDEQSPQKDRLGSGGLIRWLPPKWFPLPKYHQYQLGLFSTSSEDINYQNYIDYMRPYIQDI